MLRFLAGALAALALLSLPAAAAAAPKFPALTGRVVDSANVLSPTVETELTGKLAALETQTGRQLVVATVPDLQGYSVEDYGYQLGRAWGIGDQKADNGVVLIVAPKERKVRIEVGYGLEPVLTDAVSSVILQSAVIPRFKAGDIEGGVVAGADAIADQLALPVEDAQARAQQAKTLGPSHGDISDFLGLAILIAIFVVMGMLRGGRRRSGLGGVLPGIILGSIMSGGRGGGFGGGGGGGGGGGFSGGGGSFGGGGSSGSW